MCVPFLAFIRLIPSVSVLLLCLFPLRCCVCAWLRAFSSVSVLFRVRLPLLACFFQRIGRSSPVWLPRVSPGAGAPVPCFAHCVRVQVLGCLHFFDLLKTKPLRKHLPGNACIDHERKLANRKNPTFTLSHNVLTQCDLCPVLFLRRSY